MEIEAASWVDPRQWPDPPCRAGSRPLATEPAELAELLAACRQGRIYAVEKWLTAGKPIQMALRKPQGRWSTALSVAIETNQSDLVRLLLCNGYRLDCESRTPFARAVQQRSNAIIDLFFAWGVDATRIDAYDVITTYDGKLIERFWMSGLNLWTDINVLSALGGSPTIRSLYGLAKRLRTEHASIQRALDIGLVDAIYHRKERAIALCLWAGADPHARVPRLDDLQSDDPWLQTAIMALVLYDDHRRITLMSPDPARDDMDELFGEARSVAMVNALWAHAPPRDWSVVIRRQLDSLTYSDNSYFLRREHLEILKRFIALGGRLATFPSDELRAFRRRRSRGLPRGVGQAALLLKDPAACDPEIYRHLFSGLAHPRPARKLRRSGSVATVTTAPAPPKPPRDRAQDSRPKDHLLPQGDDLRGLVCFNSDSTPEPHQ